MEVQEYLKSKGVPVDDNVFFTNAGNTVVIPLAELLKEYAALLNVPAKGK